MLNLKVLPIHTHIAEAAEWGSEADLGTLPFSCLFYPTMVFILPHSNLEQSVWQTHIILSLVIEIIIAGFQLTHFAFCGNNESSATNL